MSYRSEFQNLVLNHQPGEVFSRGAWVLMSAANLESMRFDNCFTPGRFTEQEIEDQTNRLLRFASECIGAGCECSPPDLNDPTLSSATPVGSGPGVCAISNDLVFTSPSKRQKFLANIAKQKAKVARKKVTPFTPDLFGVGGVSVA